MEPFVLNLKVSPNTPTCNKKAHAVKHNILLIFYFAGCQKLAILETTSNEVNAFIDIILIS
jgi:hypothetical protein